MEEALDLSFDRLLMMMMMMIPVTYSAKEEISFLTACISFYCMVPKREGLMMACNKPKLVA